ncbi:DUF4157 domain-containing protein [Kordia sp. YSTF-M3]|uniref:DUF4157 domain-containing protein n=1 Tax=Kordia aestuariivivens TaxID=2759037 RepID=A0ABR7QCM0_9FLAO|nr:DUF4157 domain-containing protein [Kordia aestuariivivens]MBC8756314.1 DUF4157 domain-containing protein [Kordia aestuariivivens]
MKNQKIKAKDEKGNQNIIQRKKGKSFVKPRGAQDSFTPPTQQKQNKALPNALQSNMETSLGQDFSNVGIHTNSQKAVQMNARAYTQGENVHFAPGEFNPSSSKGQDLIGHEFTHVAQQRAGVVKPTKVLQKGVAINDNQGLEREADSFGRKAAKGETVSKYRSAGLGMRSSLRTAQAKSNVVQMAIATFGGSWDTDEYKLRQDKARGINYPAASGVRGADIKLKFIPNANADAELIGITQTAQSKVGATRPYIDGNKSREDRAISKGAERGTMIDRADDYNNPIYGVITQPSLNLQDVNTHGNASLGWHYKDKGVQKTKNPILIDKPTLSGASKESHQIFETTALATKGNQTGTYYGSVQWGWKTNAAGKHELLPFKKINDGVPSGKFMRAAKIWNDAKDSTGAETLNLPLQWTGTIHNTPLAALRTGRSVNSQILADVPRGATLTVLNDSSNWLQVQLDKTQAGMVLNRHGQAAVMTGNLIRGYIYKNLVNKDASYR